MTKFCAYTHMNSPGLHVWREGTALAVDLHPSAAQMSPGWVEFDYELEHGIPQGVRFMLFEFDDRGRPKTFEPDQHQRVLPRKKDGTFPSLLWFSEGASRVLLSDPRQGGVEHVTVHLISRTRYRPSQLYLWDPVSGASRRVDQEFELDATGPRFEITLSGQERAFFLFKFIRQGADGRLSAFEPDFANRLWISMDGGEVWTHSEAAEFTSILPQQRTLRVHFRQQLVEPAMMRIWQENSDYVSDVQGVPDGTGWSSYATDIYTNMKYGVHFWNPGRPEASRWEHPEARRGGIRIQADTDFWTLEGDPTLFPSPPAPDRPLTLRLAVKPPFSQLGANLSAHVWINRARAPLHMALAVDGHGEVVIPTYPEVVTSVKFHDDTGRWEAINRHPIAIGRQDAAPFRDVVLDRGPVLEEAPPADQFQDPPFTIRRPGAYQEGDALHFVVHAPHHARARVIGEWTDFLAHPVPMYSTRDGTYWWARVPLADIRAGTGGADYHGVKYQFLFNDHQRYQDPAAGWVEKSGNDGCSRLVRSDRFTWHDQSWTRPGWEYLVIYQLHAARFTNRHQKDPPLIRIAKEIDGMGGYLRDLGITAIQLLPVNEVGTENSWGYDPAFFYAVETGLGGPDALKALADACHRSGLALLLDVVFNHTGNVDNILWEVARDSFFDGDTRWGAMINFDHPQVRHFFAQNLVYLAQEYHIDGFRLDHTATIIHSAAWDRWSGFVTQLGSGGGREFLHAIRHAVVTEVGPRCVLIAEHLPNEPGVTNFGGPLDSQWCDDFHDRMVDACRGDLCMPRLADAMKLSQTSYDNWYKLTNYPESHDEVGNVRDRISYVAGWGRGLRMSKVAAAGSLLARGIPMYFMGAESGEDRQFEFGRAESLDLDAYLADPDRSRIRAWWREMALLHRNSCICGPSPIDVTFANLQTLAFARGARGDYFIVLNFGGWSGSINLSVLNLSWGSYRELWNSTWPHFAIAGENEHEYSNGGRDARLDRGRDLNIPAYGAVVLERVD